MKSIKKRFSFFALTFLCFTYSQAQTSLDYYLPASAQLNSTIPKPASIIGHEVGDWHVSHDKLVQYMYALASASDRIEIEEYARSHENRPLLSLKISSPKNIKNLEDLRTKHLSLSDYNQSVDLDSNEIPLVIYLGYSVHGDEPSGSNAALLVAYYLAAAEGDEIENWLDQMIIILDPSFNPDGLNRYASWVNSKKSKNSVLEPGHIEHNEPWPTGRTNHYWFDLNRDWLPVQHPESQGRITLFHKWKPNVLTDHHEMGSNGTFFFQPGIPSRNNPLTPAKNYELTESIAQYHARALDKIGSLYYSKESYDDFYLGKGSSYPDVNGAVGILFEQAASEGQVQKTSNGNLTFQTGIKNHLTTSLSTLKASFELKPQLLEHQRQFYTQIPSLADQFAVKAYVFQSANDLSKLKAFLAITEAHQIKTYQLSKDIAGFDSKESFIIPLKQNQHRMIRAIFETRTQFTDSLFYDVSAWTLPLAFDINFSEVKNKDFNVGLVGKPINAATIELPDLDFDLSQYAYAFHWYDSQSPALLYDIQQLGLRTKAATEPWINGSELFERGSIVVPVQNQILSSEQIYQSLKVLSQKHTLKISTLKSGNTSDFQLGSPRFKTLRTPKPLLVIGKGTNSYEAGEVWHLFDQRLGIALPMVTQSRLNTINLSSYNEILLVGGNYGTLDQGRIKSWVQQGGIVIALKSAGKWVTEAGLSKIKYLKANKDSTKKFLPYAERSKSRGAQRIGGAIFKVELDLTHPLNFGYQDNQLPVFKRGTQWMEIAKNPYAQPAHYVDQPLMAGYISEENLKKIPNTPAIGLSTFGKGLTISMADNPNFRGFWYGTNRLFLNAIFFGSIIEAGSAR